MILVVVESPCKARRIQDILGEGYEVVATGGSVRDIGGDGLGISVTPDGVLVNYEAVLDPTRRDRLKASAAEAEQVLLATNPDREGEATAWHCTWIIGPQNYWRVAFTALTPDAIHEALRHRRPLDINRVNAQQARRLLDRVVGWVASRLCSNQLGPNARSAGRVQSVALRILADREAEVQAFSPSRFWRIIPQIELPGGILVRGDLERFGDAEGDRAFADEASADRAMRDLRRRTFCVTASTIKERVIDAPEPFTTAGIQQYASVELGLTPRETMAALQELFDAGRITYPYADAPILHPTSVGRIRDWLSQQPHLAPGLSSGPRWAGEEGCVNEAIRPSDLGRLPSCDDESISETLYAAIWRRTVAGQLIDGVDLAVEVEISAAGPAPASVRMRSVVRRDAGWRFINPSTNDPLAVAVPGDLPIGTVITVREWTVQGWNTKAPPRYTQARLIQRLDHDGIGRPSSFARLVGSLIERGYVREEERTLRVTELGMNLSGFLAKCFGRTFGDPGYTARLEGELDAIEHQKANWQEIFQRYAREIITEAQANGLVDDPLAPRRSAPPGTTSHKCPICNAAMRQKHGKFGLFLVCSVYGCQGRRNINGSVPRSLGQYATAR